MKCGDGEQAITREMGEKQRRCGSSVVEVWLGDMAILYDKVT